MSHPRIWTIEEANAIVPRLSSLVGEQLAAAAAIERCWRRIVELVDAPLPLDQRQRASAAGPEAPAVAPAQGRPGRGGRAPTGRAEQLLARARSGSPEARAAERELSERITAYEAGWRDIEDLGVTVKDPQIGLCDFYGRVDGRLVCLCWRPGEDAILHYHELDAGYAGRKPLTAEKRLRMLN